MAVKVKIFVDNPRVEGSDRQALLEYFDEFPHHLDYRKIRVACFKRKPRRETVLRKAKSNKPSAGSFGGLDDDDDNDDHSDDNGDDDDNNNMMKDAMGSG